MCLVFTGKVVFVLKVGKSFLPSLARINSVSNFSSVFVVRMENMSPLVDTSAETDPLFIKNEYFETTEPALPASLKTEKMTIEINPSSAQFPSGNDEVVVETIFIKEEKQDLDYYEPSSPQSNCGYDMSTIDDGDDCQLSPQDHKISIMEENGKSNKKRKLEEIVRTTDADSEAKVENLMFHQASAEDDVSDDELDEVDDSDDGSDVVLADEVSDSESGDDYLLDEAHSKQIHDRSQPIKSTDLEKDVPPVYLGKNNFAWSSKEPGQAIPSFVKPRVPRLLPPAVDHGDTPSARDLWKLLFDERMIDEIVKWTNLKLSSHRKKYSGQCNQQTNIDVYKDTGPEEICALVGSLMLISIFKSKNESLRSLYSAGPCGRPIFRAIMSRKRFTILLSCLRFSNPYERSLRKQQRKDAEISYIFDKFVSNCKLPFEPGEHCRVDELLIPFCGSCPFRVRRLDKHGVKLIALSDAENSYFYDGFLYTGQKSVDVKLGTNDRTLSVPEESVLKLARCLYKSKRNLIADERFSSIELCRVLLQHGLTYVGRLKKNSPVIPPQFQSSSNRSVNSSEFGFEEDLTLVSYVPKKCQSVILLSSMHHSKRIDSTTGEPNIVRLYNRCKAESGLLDVNHSVYPEARRWPLAVFYSLVDISLVNSHILFHSSHPGISRFEFTRLLAEQLIKPHLENRSIDAKVSRDVKDIINSLLGHRPAVQKLIYDFSDFGILKPGRVEKKKTCRSCPAHLKRKTHFQCQKCEKPICLQCTVKFCSVCPQVVHRPL